MSASEILKRERERKRAQRRERVAEARQRALAAAKASGIRRILRLPEVEAAVGLKRSQIYEGIAGGKFPAPVPLGERAVGWLEDEIFTWQEERIAARDTKRGNTRLSPPESKRRRSAEVTAQSRRHPSTEIATP